MEQTPRDSKRPNPSDLTGATLGKYRLVEKMGQGGMAQVYKAYQPDLERYVAVKILHPHLTSDKEFTARFRLEARAIAALEHPHIVRIYDFDTDNGLAFLVMGYLVGSNLRERLHGHDGQNALLDLPHVARITVALADALNYAHSNGIIHRDVKPSNVIVTTDERPVLTDFGIARMVDATFVTESSGTLGTPAYMSPEQGKGEPGDARSDIYALGVILYQLCTGHLPFDAGTPYAIILKHLTAPVKPPCSLRADLPEALERVILKALEKNPDDRFQTAGQMGQAVAAAIEPRAIVPANMRKDLVPRRTFKPFANPFRFGVNWKTVTLVMATILLCVAVFYLSFPWRADRYLTALTLPPLADNDVNTLVLEGPDAVVDTWLDPDMPDGVWQAIDRSELRGASKADRILMGFNLSRLTPETNVISATLTLRVENRNRHVPSGRIVAYRIMTMWRPSSASYNSPWGKPGMVLGVDYDPTTMDRVTLPDEGFVTLNVSQAVVGWQKQGRGGGGLVLMLADDSDPQCRYGVYLTEQSDPANRPTLRIFYKAAE